MKKLISFIIVTVLLISLCTATTFAHTGYYFDYYDRFVEEYGEPYMFQEMYVSFENNEPSYYVVKVQLYFIYVDPPQHIEEVGIVNSGLVFTQIPVYIPFETTYCIYDVSDDKFYDITKIDILAYRGLYDYLVESDIATMIGDVDYDNKLTIIDATMIQRILANITYIRNNFVTDFNCDGSVDIMDATAVQKEVANLTPVTPTINEELVYTPYNDDFDISGGVLDINYTGVFNSQLEYGDHNMDSDNFGVIIKSKEQYDSVFNFDNDKYDDEFFKTKALVATVRIVTDYYMTKTIGYVGVYDSTLVLVNNTSSGSSGGTALPMAPPYVSIVEVNKTDIEYVYEILWVPVN